MEMMTSARDQEEYQHRIPNTSSKLVVRMFRTAEEQCLNIGSCRYTDLEILLVQSLSTIIMSYFESWLTARGGPTLEASEQLKKRTETPRPSRRESGNPERVRMVSSSHQPRQSIM